MSMPRLKMLFAVGCVVEVSNEKNRSVMIAYWDLDEVQQLHDYFTSTNATAILNEGASIAGSSITDTPQPKVTEKSTTVTSTHRLYRIQQGMDTPQQITGPHRMEEGWYYWLRGARAMAKARKKRKK